MPETLSALPFIDNAERTIDRYLLPLSKLGTAEAMDFVERNAESFRECLANSTDEQRLLVEEFLGEVSAETQVGGSPFLRQKLGLPSPKSEGE